ncbi:Multidrug efflux SMR transporter [Candidatus Hepatincolaceae symbiont of Richtersius coronifer]
MAWIYLMLAGIAEIGWPIGLKIMQQTEHYFRSFSFYKGLFIAAVCIAASGALLLLAQRDIPMGTAYAVWVGIGAAGTFLVGVFFYGDSAALIRYFGVGLIVLGAICLKLG